MSSLPGKALRTPVDIVRLAERFNMHFKPSLVNLISKDANLVFYLISLFISDYDAIFDVCIDSALLATSFKKCNAIMT